jgi:hypothetical protein
MATISKAMFRGPATTVDNTLYSVPSATSAIVTNIIISNASSTRQTFNISLAAVPIASGVEIQGNSLVAFDIKQPISSLEEVKGFASSTSVSFHVSGVEIT